MGELFANLAELFANLGELFANLGELFANLGELFANLGELFTKLGELFTDFFTFVLSNVISLKQTINNILSAISTKQSRKKQNQMIFT